MRSGRHFTAGGAHDDFLEGYEVTFRAVPPYQFAAWLGTGVRFYDGESFPALQLVYPDRAGRWPWQEGVAPAFRERQPILADEPEPDWSRED